jgi:hypothetical protein
LNIDFEIKNERQDCKTGAVWGVLVGGKLSAGDECVGIWLVDFIHIHETER